MEMRVSCRVHFIAHQAAQSIRRLIEGRALRGWWVGASASHRVNVIHRTRGRLLKCRLFLRKLQDLICNAARSHTSRTQVALRLLQQGWLYWRAWCETIASLHRWRSHQTPMIVPSTSAGDDVSAQWLSVFRFPSMDCDKLEAQALDEPMVAIGSHCEEDSFEGRKNDQIRRWYRRAAVRTRWFRVQQARQREALRKWKYISQLQKTSVAIHCMQRSVQHAQYCQAVFLLDHFHLRKGWSALLHQVRSAHQWQLACQWSVHQTMRYTLVVWGSLAARTAWLLEHTRIATQRRALLRWFIGFMHCSDQVVDHQTAVQAWGTQRRGAYLHRLHTYAIRQSMVAEMLQHANQGKMLRICKVWRRHASWEHAHQARDLQIQERTERFVLHHAVQRLKAACSCAAQLRAALKKYYLRECGCVLKALRGHSALQWCCVLAVRRWTASCLAAAFRTLQETVPCRTRGFVNAQRVRLIHWKQLGRGMQLWQTQAQFKRRATAVASERIAQRHRAQLERSLCRWLVSKEAWVALSTAASWGASTKGRRRRSAAALLVWQGRCAEVTGWRRMMEQAVEHYANVHRLRFKALRQWRKAFSTALWVERRMRRADVRAKYASYTRKLEALTGAALGSWKAMTADIAYRHNLMLSVIVFRRQALLIRGVRLWGALLRAMRKVKRMMHQALSQAHLHRWARTTAGVKARLAMSVCGAAWWRGRHIAQGLAKWVQQAHSLRGQALLLRCGKTIADKIAMKACVRCWCAVAWGRKHRHHKAQLEMNEMKREHFQLWQMRTLMGWQQESAQHVYITNAKEKAMWLLVSRLREEVEAKAALHAMAVGWGYRTKHATWLTWEGHCLARSQHREAMWCAVHGGELIRLLPTWGQWRLGAQMHATSRLVASTGRQLALRRSLKCWHAVVVQGVHATARLAAAQGHWWARVLGLGYRHWVWLGCASLAEQAKSCTAQHTRHLKELGSSLLRWRQGLVREGGEDRGLWQAHAFVLSRALRRWKVEASHGSSARDASGIGETERRWKCLRGAHHLWLGLSILKMQHQHGQELSGGFRIHSSCLCAVRRWQQFGRRCRLVEAQDERCRLSSCAHHLVWWRVTAQMEPVEEQMAVLSEGFRQNRAMQSWQGWATQQAAVSAAEQCAAEYWRRHTLGQGSSVWRQWVRKCLGVQALFDVCCEASRGNGLRWWRVIMWHMNAIEEAADVAVQHWSTAAMSNSLAKWRDAMVASQEANVMMGRGAAAYELCMMWGALGSVQRACIERHSHMLEEASGEHHWARVECRRLLRSWRRLTMGSSGRSPTRLRWHSRAFRDPSVKLVRVRWAIQQWRAVLGERRMRMRWQASARAEYWLRHTALAWHQWVSWGLLGHFRQHSHIVGGSHWEQQGARQAFEEWRGFTESLGAWIAAHTMLCHALAMQACLGSLRAVQAWARIRQSQVRNYTLGCQWFEGQGLELWRHRLHQQKAAAARAAQMLVIHQQHVAHVLLRGQQRAWQHWYGMGHNRTRAANAQMLEPMLRQMLLRPTLLCWYWRTRAEVAKASSRLALPWTTAQATLLLAMGGWTKAWRQRIRSQQTLKVACLSYLRSKYRTMMAHLKQLRQAHKTIRIIVWRLVRSLCVRLLERWRDVSIFAAQSLRALVVGRRWQLEKMQRQGWVRLQWYASSQLQGSSLEQEAVEQFSQIRRQQGIYAWWMYWKRKQEVSGMGLKATRAWNCSALRGVVVHWKWHTRRQTRVLERVLPFRAGLKQRSMKLGLHAWRQGGLMCRDTITMLRTASSFWSVHYGHESVRGWQTLAKRHIKFKCGVWRLVRVLCAQYFTWWRCAVVRCQWQGRLTRLGIRKRVLRRWYAWGEQRAMGTDAVQWACEHWRRRCLLSSGAGLRWWRHAVWQMNDAHEAADTAMQHWDTAVMSSALEQWRDAMVANQREGFMMSRGGAANESAMLWRAWLTVRACIQRPSQMVKAAGEHHWVRVVCRRVLGSWRLQAAQSPSELVVRLATWTLARFLCTRALRCWRDLTQMHLQHRMVATAAAIRSQLRFATGSWRSWARRSLPEPILMASAVSFRHGREYQLKLRALMRLRQARRLLHEEHRSRSWALCFYLRHHAHVAWSRLRWVAGRAKLISQGGLQRSLQRSRLEGTSPVSQVLQGAMVPREPVRARDGHQGAMVPSPRGECLYGELYLGLKEPTPMRHSEVVVPRVPYRRLPETPFEVLVTAKLEETVGAPLREPWSLPEQAKTSSGAPPIGSLPEQAKEPLSLSVQQYAEANAAFDLIDVNRDRVIDRAEWEQVAEREVRARDGHSPPVRARDGHPPQQLPSEEPVPRAARRASSGDFLQDMILQRQRIQEDLLAIKVAPPAEEDDEASVPLEEQSSPLFSPLDSSRHRNREAAQAGSGLTWDGSRDRPTTPNLNRLFASGQDNDCIDLTDAARKRGTSRSLSGRSKSGATQRVDEVTWQDLKRQRRSVLRLLENLNSQVS